MVVVDAAGARRAGQRRRARPWGCCAVRQLSIPELRALADESRRTGDRHERQVPLLHGWLPRDPVAVLARAAPADRAGHVVLVVEDVTEAHRLAEMRRDFVINVSHELKTPVGALALLAEALQSASDDPDAVRRFAGRIEHESIRLGRLVSELINLSRLEGAEPLPEPTPVLVGQVVAEAVDRAQATADVQSVSLVADGDLDATVLGNRAQLVTAVANLLDNAIRYSSAGMQVSTTVRRKPGSDGTDLDEARDRGDRGDRPRRRHRRGGSRAGLRTLLPGRPGPVGAGCRHRPGPGHRQARGRQPRWPGQRVQPAAIGLHVHHHVARRVASGRTARPSAAAQEASA